MAGEHTNKKQRWHWHAADKEQQPTSKPQSQCRRCISPFFVDDHNAAAATYVAGPVGFHHAATAAKVALLLIWLRTTALCSRCTCCF